MASHGSDESRLIERAQRGDAAAFEVLVRRYQDVAFRTAWIILRHKQDAQDAAQSGFVKAWRALESFHAGAPFRPWLLRIVANEAKNRRDARWRWNQLHLLTSEMSIANSVFAPDNLLVRLETSRELIEAISQLSVQDQQVILLRYSLELSEREMAEVLEIPAGTVKSRLHRALNRLKGVLEHVPE